MNFTKRIRIVFLLLTVSCGFFFDQKVFAEDFWPVGPEVHAEAAIIMEADTGAILYEKNIHVQHYPASITKIMTTLLALENTSLQDTITFSYDSVHKTEGSLVGFMDGEQLSMEACLYSVMLASGNEAAYAVAEHVGGTIDNFVQMMNERAIKLGCTETHFSNPHGLPDDTHVTSAHDMALIAQEAYKNENFRTITKTVSYTVPATNRTTETRPLSNHHSMLKQGVYKYPYCTGGKTGYTNAARNTLVTYAEKDGMTLICVVMKDDVSKDQYLDTIALLDYSFNNFKKIPVSENDLGLQLSSNGFFPIENNPLSKDAGKISLSTSSQLVVPNQSTMTDITPSITFTNKATDEIATISCRLGEHFVGNVSILYTPGKRSAEIAAQTQKNANKTNSPVKSKPFPVKQVLIVVFISLCIIGLIGVLLYCIRNGIFEPSYIQEKPKLKRHKTNPRRSPHRNSKEKKKKQEPRKPVGSNKTPRLQSEFDTDHVNNSSNLIDDYQNPSYK